MKYPCPWVFRVRAPRDSHRMLPDDCWTNKETCPVAMSRDGIAGTLRLRISVSFSAVSGQAHY
jgi:hypothetical protein